MLGIIDLYSKRKRNQELQGKVEVYKYDEIPLKFRNQVVHIWIQAIGNYSIGSYIMPLRNEEVLSNRSWETIHSALCKEYGAFRLGKHAGTPLDQCVNLLREGSVDEALDIIELSFRFIDNVIREHRRYNVDIAIEELNARFKENGIGYQYIGGEIIRSDSQYIHAEAVVPAIKLLWEEEFAGASEEFLEAHKYYREKKFKEAINYALNAFESVMKAICERKKWECAEKDGSAKKLLDVLFKHNFIPDYLVNYFSHLKELLELGLPTIRNREAAHGQGEVQKDIPEHLASYCLHLAASNIVFLVQCYKIQK